MKLYYQRYCEKKQYKKIFMEVAYKAQIFRSSFPYHGMMNDGIFKSLGYFICANQQWDEVHSKEMIELLFFDPSSRQWAGYVANATFDAFIDPQTDDMFDSSANPPRLGIEDLEEFIKRYIILIYIIECIIFK